MLVFCGICDERWWVVVVLTRVGISKLTLSRGGCAGFKAYAGEGSDLTHFTRVFLRRVTTRASIELVFRAVHNEVMSATNGLMRPLEESRLKRDLVLVDRGGAPPPFVPRQYLVVLHHVVGQEQKQHFEMVFQATCVNHRASRK